MSLDSLGCNDALEQSRVQCGFAEFAVGRVVSEHRERYAVMTEFGEREAEISGSLRHAARRREDFPAVGDWVALEFSDGNLSIIHGILPRTSVLSRLAVGGNRELQIIATNIDHALLVQALDRDFNLNRLERYLTLCHASGAGPIIVLTKTDLLERDAVDAVIDRVRHRVPGAPVIALSNLSGDGLDGLKALLVAGMTYCLLGSSGVGKSTLLNNLSGRSVVRTDAISESTNKGRHVTSHRELIVLEGGAILIDNPGMREVGIADTARGLETTFDQLYRIAQGCRFKDCNHTSEKGCAVLEAVASGEIDPSAYASFRKMEKEQAHAASTALERRHKDKAFGKMLKNYQKDLGR